MTATKETSNEAGAENMLPMLQVSAGPINEEDIARLRSAFDGGNHEIMPILSIDEHLTRIDPFIPCNIALCHPDAKEPAYAHDDDGCFDLYCIEGAVIPPRGTVVFNTHVRFQFPRNYVMPVYSRSGHGFKKDCRLANCVGIIDRGYTDEVRVKITNDSDTESMEITKGQAVAQAMIIPRTVVKFNVVSQSGIEATERGGKGFGSSDKKAM